MSTNNLPGQHAQLTTSPLEASASRNPPQLVTGIALSFLKKTVNTDDIFKATRN
jgi:hypothetical protein